MDSWWIGLNTVLVVESVCAPSSEAPVTQLTLHLVEWSELVSMQGPLQVMLPAMFMPHPGSGQWLI